MLMGFAVSRGFTLKDLLTTHRVFVGNIYSDLLMLGSETVKYMIRLGRNH